MVFVRFTIPDTNKNNSSHFSHFTECGVFLQEPIFMEESEAYGQGLSKREEGKKMTKVSYSTVFNQTADQVWSVIRDFNSYPVWVASVTESHIEDSKSGDSVGAIRNFAKMARRFVNGLLLMRNSV